MNDGKFKYGDKYSFDHHCPELPGENNILRDSCEAKVKIKKLPCSGCPEGVGRDYPLVKKRVAEKKEINVDKIRQGNIPVHCEYCGIKVKVKFRKGSLVDNCMKGECRDYRIKNQVKMSRRRIRAKEKEKRLK